MPHTAANVDTRQSSSVRRKMERKTKIAKEKSRRMETNETNKTKWNKKLNKKHIQRRQTRARSVEWDDGWLGWFDCTETKRMNERRHGIRASLFSMSWCEAAAAAAAFLHCNRECWQWECQYIYKSHTPKKNADYSRDFQRFCDGVAGMFFVRATILHVTQFHHLRHFPFAAIHLLAAPRSMCHSIHCGWLTLHSRFWNSFRVCVCA